MGIGNGWRNGRNEHSLSPVFQRDRSLGYDDISFEVPIGAHQRQNPFERIVVMEYLP